MNLQVLLIFTFSWITMDFCKTKDTFIS